MKIIKRIGLSLIGIVGLLVLWGVAVEPRLIEERRERVAMPSLPAEWEGQEVALLADLQVGMWGANTGTIRRIVERLVEAPPAAVLIAGDFVYKADDRIEETVPRAVELLRPILAAGIPTFAVLGNHDYSLDKEDDPINQEVAAAVENALEQAGVRVLENEPVRLTLGVESGGEPLYIVGIGDLWAGHSDPDEALRSVPSGAARIIFMHHPESFEDLPAGQAPLALAGHTHGGQISVPFTPHWSWMSLVKDQHFEANGWAQDREEPSGNRLYVNVGIGFSSVPVRINSRPELTRFTLSADPGEPASD